MGRRRAHDEDGIVYRMKSSQPAMPAFGRAEWTVGDALNVREINNPLRLLSAYHLADSILARLREQGLRSMLLKARCLNDLLWPFASSGRTWTPPLCQAFSS